MTKQIFAVAAVSVLAFAPLVAQPAPPTASLMPFTADAYPTVSTFTGGTIFKTTQLASTGEQVLADRLLVSFVSTTSTADRTAAHSLAGSRLNGMAARPVGQIMETAPLVVDEGGIGGQARSNSARAATTQPTAGSTRRARSHGRSRTAASSAMCRRPRSMSPA